MGVGLGQGSLEAVRGDVGLVQAAADSQRRHVLPAVAVRGLRRPRVALSLDRLGLHRQHLGGHREPGGPAEEGTGRPPAEAEHEARFQGRPSHSQQTKLARQEAQRKQAWADKNPPKRWLQDDASRAWDWAEKISREAGFPPKDRNGKLVDGIHKTWVTEMLVLYCERKGVQYE